MKYFLFSNFVSLWQANIHYYVMSYIRKLSTYLQLYYYVALIMWSLLGFYGLLAFCDTHLQKIDSDNNKNKKCGHILLFIMLGMHLLCWHNFKQIGGEKNQGIFWNSQVDFQE